MVARRRVMESAAIDDKENIHTSSTIGFSRDIPRDGKDQNPFEISKEVEMRDDMAN
jgi:hypothetical protein